MHDFRILQDLSLIMALAVVIVALFSRLKLPPIAGFILAGVLAGPNGLGWISQIEQVQLLAEVGVVLLLFGIGLELSLDRLRRLWKPILVGGTIQVGLSIAVSYLIAQMFGLPAATSLIIGFVISISSTAIVLKALQQRGEVDAPHGRFTLGILVFQDLCVVPMILIIPLLSDVTADLTTVAWSLGRAALIVLGVLVASRYVVPRLMDIIAETRQRHLFIMTVLLICIGTAWLTAEAGTSLALGAFLAGMVVAGGEYRHQAMSDLIPFREVLTSIFFVSVGMLLDPTIIMSSFGTVAGLLVAIILGKFIIVFVTGLMLKLPTGVSTRSAAGLAQVGEFSFILITLSAQEELLTGALGDSLTAVAILSMAVTPLGLMAGPHLAAGMGRMPGIRRWIKVPTAEDIDEERVEFRNHVIIGGYGLAGRNLSRILKQSGIPYLIAELNIDNVRKARSEGEPIFFADITSPEVLEHLNAHHAKEFILVVNDPEAVIRAIKAARQVAPNLHILARTRYQLDTRVLEEAGANEVIVAEVEGAMEIISRVLNRHQVQADLVLEALANIRRAPGE